MEHIEILGESNYSTVTASRSASAIYSFYRERPPLNFYTVG